MLSLLLLINSVRASTSQITEDKWLTKAAEIRCHTMSVWSHLGFPIPAQRLLGYYYMGENLATGYNPQYGPRPTFNAWQNSPAHKANDEDTHYSKIGYAYCNNSIGTTSVLLFGGND